MKLKATKKEILNGYNKVLRIGYCDLQHLLNYESPFAYSAGVYGWNCDYYNIDGTIISTGYSPIGQDVDYNLIKEYNKKALEVRHNGQNYKDIDKKLKKLLKQFIKKAVQQ